LEHHFKFGVGGLLLEHGLEILWGEGGKFHPTPIVFENVRVVKLGVELDF
jgi:hypothetical protein